MTLERAKTYIPQEVELLKFDVIQEVKRADSLAALAGEMLVYASERCPTNLVDNWTERYERLVKA